MGERVLAASTVATMVGDFDRDPAYQGLAEGLRILITDGRIARGVRLPSERELTDALGVSRTTVARAYAELRDLGFLVSRRGSGSVASLPASRGLRGDHLLPPGDLPPDKLDLTCAAPVPGPGLLAAYQRAVAELPQYLSGTGYYPSGLPALKEAVAERYAARGLPTTAEQVMIVPGALAGIAVVARALVKRGGRTLVENPTYPNAIATLRHSGGRLVSTDVGREDAHVGDLVDVARQVSPALALLIPDFHNPTGHLMADADRERVAHALARSGTRPVIDESMVELPLEGQEMPSPFAAYSPEAVTVGSLSKPFSARAAGRRRSDPHGRRAPRASTYPAAAVPRRRRRRPRRAPPRVEGADPERRPEPVVRAARRPRALLRPGALRRRPRRDHRAGSGVRARGWPRPVPADPVHRTSGRARGRDRAHCPGLARRPGVRAVGAGCGADPGGVSAVRSGRRRAPTPR
ncbi:MAG: PLP-dependent aminotransferase family protein [Propionibacteriales bacterium]|nr:PLP-dependent aminotransferase family protein [Propionibacteriales bacterium]